MNVFVTGGSGFIGREVVKQLINKTDLTIINIDCLTYAGSYYEAIEYSLKEVDKKRYIFKKVNLCDAEVLQLLFKQYKPNYLIHLAAESHVDKSINSPINFIQSNIFGTFNLLESVRHYLKDNPQIEQRFRFLNVSTDEVFGELKVDEKAFVESNKVKPNSPYSASKASADLLVDAWVRTYQLPCMQTHCSNNYGCYQHPEKLIPFMTKQAILRKPLTIYGTGNQIRDWLHVSDHVNALLLILFKGKIGRHYNIGANNEMTNNKMVLSICDQLEKLDKRESKPFYDYKQLVTHITDRKGHDVRYAVDSRRISNELNWKPEVNFNQGFNNTIAWYRSHFTNSKGETNG